MAIRILCKQVGKEFTLETLENAECPGCFSEIDSNHVILEGDKPVNGFKLTYEKTGECEEFTNVNDIVLGRESSGSEFFKKILVEGKPVISRKHCGVKKINNQLVIYDKKSTNGTYAGIAKQDCRLKDVVLEDYDVLYLGEEVFKVRLIYAGELNATLGGSEENLTTKYKCMRCGLIFDNYSEFCPNDTCREFHGLKAVN